MKLAKRLAGIGMAAVMLSTAAAVPAQAAVNDTYETASQVETLNKKISVKISARSRTVVRLRWSKDQTCTGYKVFMKTDKGWKCKQIVRGKNNVNCRITGLRPGTKYEFMVQPFTRKKNKTVYGTKVKVSTTTKYGVAGSYYGGKYLDLHFSTKQWAADYNDESGALALVYKGSDAKSGSIALTVMASKLSAEERGMTLDDFAAQLVEIFNSMEMPAKIAGHGKLFGLKSVEVDIQLDDTVTTKYVLAKKGSRMYMVLKMYEKGQSKVAEKRIPSALKNYTLK